MGLLDIDSLPKRLRLKYRDIVSHSDLEGDLDEFDSKLSSLRESRLSLGKDLE